MRIIILSFTERGSRLSETLAGRLGERDVRLYTKCSRIRGETSVLFLEDDLKQWVGQQMKEKCALIFIGACGIAVRTIAPYITDKLHDSPVLVIDENGRYVIPVLSGHAGGANELAVMIAKRLEALPVITTATDIHRAFAVDVFAKKNGLFIVNREGIAKVSSKVLAGEEIRISIESGHLEKPEYSEGEMNLPEGVKLTEYPPEGQVDVAVTSEERIKNASLWLRPREYIIGMGCRRGKEADKIEAFIGQVMKEAGIFTEQVAALASIDLKRGEEGFLSWSQRNGVPFVTYDSGELKAVEEEIHPSAFVKEITGVDNVCERAALKAAGPGGKLIYEKHAKDGMTIAVAKRKWRVSFDET